MLLRKYGARIDEFDQRKKFALYFNVAILIRRALSAALLVFFQKFVYAQLFRLTVVNLIALLLLIQHKPNMNWRDLIINITYEWFFLIIHWLNFLVAYDNHVHSYSEDATLIICWGVIGYCLNKSCNHIFVYHLPTIGDGDLDLLKKHFDKQAKDLMYV